MFDSLKEKLGRFQEDVEETAEEKAAEAEDEGESERQEGETPPDADAATPEGEEGTAPTAEPAGETTGDVAPTGAETATVDADRGTTGSAGGGTADAESGADVRGGTVGEAEPAPAPDAGEAAADAEVDTDVGTEADAGAEADAESGGDAEAAVEAEPEDEDGDDSTGLGRKLKSAARGRFVIEEEDLEDPLWELEMALLDSDVEMEVAEEILDGIREELVGETRRFTESTGSVVEDALRSALLDVISVGQFDFDRRVHEAEKPVVVVFTGVNGVGKTTTIAKMARYLERQGLSTVLANGDTYRAGANEQIEEHAERLDKKLISHDKGGDPTAVIYDAVEYAEANDVDVVLGDTAGRLHTDRDLMAQLEKIHRVVDPDMTIFVDEAVAGQDATRRAREFDEAAEIDGTVLTKADADAQGGAAISIAHVTGKPILFLGTGQGYDDLERFDPEWMVDQLLGEE